MVDFGILNRSAAESEPATIRAMREFVEPEVVDEPFEVAAPDPFDLDRLKQALVPFEKEVNKMLETARAHKITDQESNELAVTYGGQAQGLLKKINAEANAIKAPYKKIVDGINAVTKPFRDNLAGIKDNLKLKISAYSREQAEINRRIAAKKAAEERKRLEVEAEKERQAEIARQEKEKAEAEALQADLDEQAKAEGVEPVKVDIPEVVDPGLAPIVEPSVADPKKPIRTEAGTASIVEKWDYELISIHKVPRDYTTVTVNDKAVKEAISAGVRMIDGLRIFPADQVRFRGK